MSVIKALTPAIHAGQTFDVHRGEQEFPAWVLANPQACWRRFEVLSEFGLDKEGIGDGTPQWRFQHPVVVLVAYPREFGKYGANNERDLDTMIWSDFAQIDEAIGADGAANYVSGQTACLYESMAVTKRERDVISAITFRLDYDRSY